MLKTVSFKTFVETGQFGGVRLGMSQAQIEEILGKAEWAGDLPLELGHDTAILYGHYEFHLIENRLLLIHYDWFHFEALKSCAAFDVDPWILRPGQMPEEMEQGLREIHVGYTVERPHRWNPDCALIRTESGVELLFIVEAEESAYLGLEAISAVGRDGATTGA